MTVILPILEVVVNASSRWQIHVFGYVCNVTNKNLGSVVKVDGCGTFKSPGSIVQNIFELNYNVCFLFTPKKLNGDRLIYRNVYSPLLVVQSND